MLHRLRRIIDPPGMRITQITPITAPIRALIAYETERLALPVIAIALAEYPSGAQMVHGVVVESEALSIVPLTAGMFQRYMTDLGGDL